MSRVLKTLGLALGLACLATTATSCKRQGGLHWAQSSAPEIRVNQVGYLPGGPKLATIVSESDAPLPVTLEVEGKVLWSGKSTPLGLDEASGDHVHHIDFSDYQEPGEGLLLVSGDEKSFPFTISEEIYARLPYDALKYFYHNRSGISIVMPYVPDQTWTRPAGHVSDQSVPCWRKEQCTYSLDVSGGWYDAGDHGKYVVNGGISAWTLLALYERSVHLAHGAAAVGDGMMNIPESGNGVPDLLDEARWEVEFLLKMQVPANQPLEGMVHHKMHDPAWSALGIEPPSHAEKRALHPPSTAATLNMAAVAAQAARIWKKIDPKFSAYCENAAMRAWLAAEKTPDKYASPMDKNGGGPYDDKIVTDEFFWAAAELYVTTGHEAYLAHLRQSPHFKKFPTRLVHPDGSSDGDGVTGSMTWQSTAALGWITLAMVPSDLPDDERQRLRRAIVSAGDDYLEVIAGEGYRQPLGLGDSGKYPWGSNSFVLNNMVILSLAYDLSKDAKYAGGVVEGMDYILGRNPMVQSYVTGYGTVPLKQPHHRFWANVLNPRFPPPPPGAVSGGPNSSLQDPQTKASGLHTGLPPQKCFVDHIQAWSVNEITINWNAPFAWTAVFLNEWRGN